MKITGGKYNSIEIKTAEFKNIKPTLSQIRQSIFNTLSSMMNFEGRVFFDMFAGSGIMSLEAVSRGFRAVTFEKDRNTALMIKSAFSKLGIMPELYFGDCIKNINKTELKADVIFIDPPYASNLYEAALYALKNGDKLQKDGIIILEHPVSKIIDIDTAGFALFKEKISGDKKITYLQMK